MKIALVHDFLVQMGGAEKVVEEWHDMFPDAPIYTSVYDANAMPDHFRKWDIRTTFLQKMVKHRTHRMALFLYPMAFESFDFSEYDFVLSSSSAIAKGIITQPKTVHVCYKHTPMRYAWMTGSYMKNERSNKLTRGVLVPGMHYLRMWDLLSAARVDRFIANSSAAGRRIRKFYGRDCEVIFPPVDVSRFSIADKVEDYCVVVSRLAPYKRLDLAVDAFSRLNKPLKIIGEGRDYASLKARAGNCVEFLGRLDDKTTAQVMAQARAYIMPGEEDFGLSPVEANVCGRPVIAYGAGGALDTQIDGKTGILFPHQTVDSLCEAIECMETIDWDPQFIREHAMQFSTEVFRQRFFDVVNEYSHDRLNGFPRATNNPALKGYSILSEKHRPLEKRERQSNAAKPQLNGVNGDSSHRELTNGFGNGNAVNTIPANGTPVSETLTEGAPLRETAQRETTHHAA